ncbi:MAG TPA: indole-3-glycerol phosphate synthase TrpC [Gemmatimonadales bacterium]|nr:indole-3-glycerol phosphate synthase TrpC [Gemmatimonadales bacterium]
MPRATLEEILVGAHRRVEGLRPRTAELERRAAAAPPPAPFGRGLIGPFVGVIAEAKRRSPSAGPIREQLEPVAYARACEAGGACAISVLTDELHFGGSLDDLARVARAVHVPTLRKDFILDELQLLEARAAGASAVLLIVRAMTPVRLRELAAFARGLGLATLIEVHLDAELEIALAATPTALGVNSRDLTTFATDMAVAERLLPLVPAVVIAVGESGIENRNDVERMAAAGADLVLVGTSIARSPDPSVTVRALAGVPRMPRGMPS